MAVLLDSSAFIGVKALIRRGCGNEFARTVEDTIVGIHDHSYVSSFVFNNKLAINLRVLG